MSWRPHNFTNKERWITLLLAAIIGLALLYMKIELGYFKSFPIR